MGMARTMSQGVLGKQIEGVWHTGVVVYGLEYFYGGGIQKCPPQQVVDTFGLRPVQQIELGTTEIDQETFHEFLQTIESKYTMDTYDLFTNNCNSFTDEVSTFLTAKGIPKHIIDLPNEVLRSPMGQTFAPMIQAMNQRMQQNMIPFSSPVPTATAPATSNSSPKAQPKEEEVKYELTVKVSGRSLETHKLAFTVDDPTVLEIKQAVQMKTGFKPEDQRVIFAGSLLKDPSKKASECGLKSGITVHMSPKVGAVAAKPGEAVADNTGSGASAGAANNSQGQSKTVTAALAQMQQTAEKDRKVAFKTLVKIMSNM